MNLTFDTPSWGSFSSSKDDLFGHGHRAYHASVVAVASIATTDTIVDIEVAGMVLCRRMPS